MADKRIIKYVVSTALLLLAGLLLIKIGTAQTFYPRDNTSTVPAASVPTVQPYQPTPSYSPTPSYQPTYPYTGSSSSTVSPIGTLDKTLPTIMQIADRYGVWQTVVVISLFFLLRYLWAERQVKQDSTVFIQNHLSDLTNRTNREIMNIKDTQQQLYTGLQQDVQISQRLTVAMENQFKLLTDTLASLNLKLIAVDKKLDTLKSKAK
jgi:hypothetical protein